MPPLPGHTAEMEVDAANMQLQFADAATPDVRAACGQESGPPQRRWTPARGGDRYPDLRRPETTQESGLQQRRQPAATALCCGFSVVTSPWTITSSSSMTSVSPSINWGA